MDFQALRQLARDIAGLEGPDRRLDLRLFALCPGGLSIQSAAYLTEAGRLGTASIATICEELEVPRFTEAVDATLPWEHILSVKQAPSGALWGAVQAGGLAVGESRFYFGWGASEALARRAAALETFTARPESEKPAAREAPEGAEPPEAPPGEPPPGESPPSEAPPGEAWKFEF